MISTVLNVQSLASYTSGLGDDLLPFSKPLSIAFRTFHVFHFYLRVIPRHKVWAEMWEKNSAKFVACAGGGAGLYIFFGGSTGAQVVGKSVLVALSVPDIRDTQKKVLQAYNKFMSCLCGDHPFPIGFMRNKAELDKASPENDYRLLYALTYLPDTLFELALRIEASVQAAILLIYACAELSIASFGILEAILHDPSIQSESLTGIGFHGAEIYERLIANPPELSARIEENKEEINRYLEYMKSPYKASDMKDLVKRAEPIQNIFEQAVSTGRQVAFNAAYLATGVGVKALATPNKQLIPRSRSSYDNGSSSHSSRKASSMGLI
jgi:hypothetical protein